MLSKVAERVYWAARYLDRIENTARLISIYDKLLFDLPKTVQLSWYNLVVINNIAATYDERYSVKDERNVIKFMLGDEKNPSSVVSSLAAMRENVRTTRDVVPEETWEVVNQLSIYVQGNISKGINRSERHEFLDSVIKGCQQIQGLLYGSMAHDNAWNFLRLGRNIERADMTSRNLDAGIAGIIETTQDEVSINSKQIILGNVLRSLNAMQSYRRKLRTSVQSKEVVEYLLHDDEFPRAIGYCSNVLLEAASALPKSRQVVQAMKKMRQNKFEIKSDEDIAMPLRDYLNDLQIDIGNLHEIIRQNWFSK